MSSLPTLLPNGCIICLKPLTTRGELVEEAGTLLYKKFLEQLLEGLHVPLEYKDHLMSVCTLDVFCDFCMKSVKRVMWLQSKIEAMQAEVVKNVGRLGTAIMESTSKLDEKSIEGTVNSWSPGTKDLWRKFRLPVISNFGEGRLSSVTTPMNTPEDSILEEYPDNENILPTCEAQTQVQLELEIPRPSATLSHPDKVEDQNNRRKMPVKRKVVKEKSTTLTDRGILSNLNEQKQQVSSPGSNEQPKVHLVCPSPSCTFKAYFSIGPSSSPVTRTYEGYASAICIMKRHFMNVHSPKTKFDMQVTEDGHEFFGCTSCPYRSFVTDNLLGKRLSTHIMARRASALLVLCTHRLQCHYEEALTNNSPEINTASQEDLCSSNTRNPPSTSK